ncbi:gamma carbonic anhydrase family protein [bacterium]|nr:gamma carbonic anhydrase family protein [bacterium]
MPVYEINGKKPSIGTNTWIAPSAEIIGDVTIGNNCYIGFGAIIRGDFGKIIIGEQSLVEEAVVIHCASKVTIGNRVIIGHQVMLHDTTLHDNTLIGMQSMICDFSVINEWSIVAEQSLVLKKQRIPSGKIYGGSPAKEIGLVNDQHLERFNLGIQAYSDLREQYLQNFKKLDI